MHQVQGLNVENGSQPALNSGGIDIENSFFDANFGKWEDDTNTLATVKLSVSPEDAPASRKQHLVVVEGVTLVVVVLAGLVREALQPKIDILHDHAYRWFVKFKKLQWLQVQQTRQNIIVDNN